MNRAQPYQVHGQNCCCPALTSDQRPCHVFEDPADFLALSLDVPYARARNWLPEETRIEGRLE